jgi:hypothetical protein
VVRKFVVSRVKHLILNRAINLNIVLFCSELYFLFRFLLEPQQPCLVRDSLEALSIILNRDVDGLKSLMLTDKL